MSRKQADLIVSIVLMAIIGWMVWEARMWDPRARLFPVAIGIPALGLALLQVGFAARSIRAASSQSLAVDPQAAQRTRHMIGWILAIVAGIVLLGFEIGSALLTFAFLRFAAHERVWLSATLAIGTFLFFYVAFDRALNIPFPPGVLTGWK